MRYEAGKPCEAPVPVEEPCEPCEPVEQPCKAVEPVDEEVPLTFRQPEYVAGTRLPSTVSAHIEQRLEACGLTHGRDVVELLERAVLDVLSRKIHSHRVAKARRAYEGKLTRSARWRKHVVVEPYPARQIMQERHVYDVARRVYEKTSTIAEKNGLQIDFSKCVETARQLRSE